MRGPLHVLADSTLSIEACTAVILVAIGATLAAVAIVGAAADWPYLVIAFIGGTAGGCFAKATMYAACIAWDRRRHFPRNGA